ncbi:MAG TPA: Rho termination factor N-terminal domain-containing protein, partial [Candidatus Limnocylindria bacterium]|nr:Rho termination factor N-terminal domain-containing protein [Candidatus Limnocylindria bacterium]
MPRPPKDPSAPKKPKVVKKKPATSKNIPAPEEAASPVHEELDLTPSTPVAEAPAHDPHDDEPLVVKSVPIPRVPMEDPNEDTPVYEPDIPQKPAFIVTPRNLNLHELQPMPIGPLAEVANEFGVDNYGTLKRQEIIFQIVQRNLAAGGTINTRGILEVMPEGFGFLRSPAFNYLPCPEDIYVSPSQIRRFDLGTGDDVEGQVRPPKEKEKFYALLKVEKVAGIDPDKAKDKTHFDNLTPLFPNKRFLLETAMDELSTRVVDLVCPVG